MSSYIWLFLFLLVSFLIFYLFRRNSESGSVKSVKKTPRREVEEMTVNEYEELGLQYVEAQGFDIAKKNDQSYFKRDNTKYYVKFDPAGDAEDPRTLNQMLVEIRKSNMDAGILITSGNLTEKSATLADRGNIEVFDPDTIIRWKRQRKTPSRSEDPDEQTD